MRIHEIMHGSPRGMSVTAVLKREAGYGVHERVMSATFDGRNAKQQAQAWMDVNRERLNREVEAIMKRHLEKQHRAKIELLLGQSKAVQAAKADVRFVLLRYRIIKEESK